MTKGIILAGGSGTRLYPMTAVQSKQLQPVYDKPMIYYPLATLMLAGIRDILIISTPHDTPTIQRLLGDGSQWGICLQYAVQPQPRGIAEAFMIGAEFIGNEQVCLILGDNLFYGKLDFLRRGIATNDGATIFAYRVHDPERYGVVEFSPDGRVLSIEEKPAHPRSHYAIPGLYIFTPDVVELAHTLQPSSRGELEITDLQRLYLKQGRLRAEIIGRGVAWLDTGTPDALLEASLFISAIEKRQGLKIACLEEIALYEGFITREQFFSHVERLPKCSYRDYCLRIADEIIARA
ncbi:MAG: glucose-1-phosphate thymidylyltransferase RfbA [Bacteroidota bacterium]|nr:glucose-1-phosphate thymidylyltransferase RfbA [Candidatus Kapabacteria bacterium]MCS7303411.1 glucose-1-phosphate thymidylyltransferase RfbA [Candidatus Kapabacteria bacterium]MCX7937738.1 glucose-1-phosphate thymidylyltransferase RfbA [Chlorobiota bacterium]MDW8075440.1 glucose-1-phosphate thymidylyltransferase RfbA [Bacteroidota bacterium]MDW8272224.1 glucose-1-phosphate thymidylyltransferase RfbA [Bacteroidota bacterium]